MTFQPGMIRGVQGNGSSHSHIDYRLARRSIIRNFHNGRLSKLDICDAHPELVRAARNVGEETSEICPVCEDVNVVLVSYVFGQNLAPSGHCVTSKDELKKYAKRSNDMTCYVVEVCPACSWNHLARSIHL